MAATPIFRFTIFNNALYPSGIIVPEPLGWAGSAISLERDKTYHSLVEYFKGTFIWWGKGRTILREIETAQGPDALAGVLIELNYGQGFEEVFTGLVDVSLIEDISKAKSFYKAVAPIIRDDFWAKFMNRSKIPVNLEGSTDLDGNARTPISKIVLPLPSQIIPATFDGIDTSYISKVRNPVNNQFSNGDYYQFGFNGIVNLNEIEQFFNIPTDINEELPAWILEAKFNGEYTFNITVPVIVEALNLSASPRIIYRDAESNYVELIFMINSTEINFNEHSLEVYPNTPLVGPPLTDVGNVDYKINIFNHTQTVVLEKGDIVRVFLRITNHTFGPDQSKLIVISEGMDGEGYLDYYVAGEHRLTLNILANTLYPDTETDAFLIKDAAESIISKYVGADNVVISNALDNCKGLNTIMRGKHVRGYEFSEKEMSMNFEEWREGASPLLALGLGYTKVLGVNKIEIEEIADFYNKTTVLNISNVPDLVRTYDLEKYLKSLKIGFKKWSAESGSGIDDAQAVHYMNTKFATIGKDQVVECDWFGASLGIEQTRRNRVELGKDWRLDEDILVIAVQEYEGGYTPELDENFDSISGLLNSETRYNTRHTVERMFKRWQNYFNGCLQHLPTEKFYFSRGEGNYSVISKLNAGDCEVSPEDATDYGLEGNQNINVTDDFIFIPKLYKGKIPMTWEDYKTIRDNRKNAIGISQTEENHIPMFIIDFDYKIAEGSADVVLMLGEDVEL